MTTAQIALVVDDSQISRMMARQFILAIFPAWRVEEAASGEAALKTVEVLSPSLILIDLDMPGMGGKAAAEKLRQAFPRIPITLLADHVQDVPQTFASSLNLGVVEKPITEARMRQVLAGFKG